MTEHDISPTLAFSGIEFAYRDHLALRGLTASFSARRIAVLGPNGAGKSTLMGVLDTSRLPSAGTFTHLGHSPLEGDLKAYRHSLGVVPQGLAMMPGYSCRELLHYVCWLRGISSAEAPARVDEALEAVSLNDRAGASIRHLSGGMRQRLALAQALVNRPKLLLLDEPTVGLDPQQRAQFRAVLLGLEDTTIVFATHLVDDVAALAQEIAIIDGGRLLWSGTTSDFVGDAGVNSAAIEARYLELAGQVA